MKTKNLVIAAMTIIAFFLFLFVSPVSAESKTKSSTKKEQKKTTKKADSNKKKKSIKAKTKSTKSSPKTKSTTKTVSSKKVNINKADVETLSTLDGIGQKRAEAIVKYRKKHGAFKKPEDIMQVEGIGEKTYKNNKNLIKLK